MEDIYYTYILVGIYIYIYISYTHYIHMFPIDILSNLEIFRYESQYNPLNI